MSDEVRFPKRTAHSLAVDRGINAKVRYNKFGVAYAQSPNRSDLEGFDTKGDIRPIPRPKPVEEPKIVATKEFLPDSKEKKELTRIFLKKLTTVEQHKDLLKTTNVVTTKKQLSLWKENPKNGDVRGIDTRAKGVHTNRINLTHKRVGSPEITMKPFGWNSLRGDIAFGKRVGNTRYIPNQNYVGDIRVDTKNRSKDSINRTLAHELGHAYDRNITGKTKIGQLNLFPRTAGFEQFDDGIDKVPFGIKRNIFLQRKNQVKKVTGTKINPYDPKLVSSKHITYRNSNEELFADWFSGLITNKSKVKRVSSSQYRQFRKSNKSFIKELKESDKATTNKFIKELKKSIGGK